MFSMSWMIFSFVSFDLIISHAPRSLTFISVLRRCLHILQNAQDNVWGIRTTAWVPTRAIQELQHNYNEKRVNSQTVAKAQQAKKNLVWTAGKVLAESLE